MPAPEEESEGFTVRDRRRFTTEEAPAAPSSEPSPTPAPAPVPSPEPIAMTAEDFGPIDESEEMDEMMGEENGALPDVYSILLLFLNEMRSLAWLRMGLVANPSTGQIERDLQQAKVAIDTAAFLASELEPVVAPEERLPLRALISDLQMNFVEQNKQG